MTASPRPRRRYSHEMQTTAIYISGRVANLTLRQAGGDGTWYGVDITQGVDLEGCDVWRSSASSPLRRRQARGLRRSFIRDGKTNWLVFVHHRELGTLEDNDITANANAGGGD